MKTFSTREAAAHSGLPKSTIESFAREWHGYMEPVERGTFGRGNSHRWSAQQVELMYVIAQIRVARSRELQLARDLLREGHATCGAIGMRLDQDALPRVWSL